MKIPNACENACIIEASTLKPGNVHPGREGYTDMVFSGVLLAQTLQECLSKDISLGYIIKKAITDRMKIISENTNLGIVLLCVPLAKAAFKGSFKKVYDITSKTTVKDAVDVAKAIQISGAHIGTPQRGPDIRNGAALKEICDQKLTLLDLFLLSSQWDSIAAEWVEGFPITFSGSENLMAGESVLKVYINILSRHRDSLIQRRFGEKVANKISEKAQKLKNCPVGELKKWDRYLYRKGINPGTTADLVTSSLFVALLQKEELLTRFADEIRTGGW